MNKHFYFKILVILLSIISLTGLSFAKPSDHVVNGVDSGWCYPLDDVCDSSGNCEKPIENISFGFMCYNNAFNGYHYSQDFTYGYDVDDPVYAVADGEIIKIRKTGGYGGGNPCDSAYNTMLVKYGYVDNDGTKNPVYIFYGHVKNIKGTPPGATDKELDINIPVTKYDKIAELNDPRANNCETFPPHLHLTVMPDLIPNDYYAGYNSSQNENGRARPFDYSGDCLKPEVFFNTYDPAKLPFVRVMPDGIKTSTKYTAYAWAGKEITIWGNVKWGDATNGTYEWDIDNNGTVDYSGIVTNPRDIAINHTYTFAGTYYAKLRVTDGEGLSSEATVRIDVLPVDDGNASTNLAIERGLKRLYLDQSADGSWAGEPALGALSVLSFENHGHLPIGSTTDIYYNTVVNGLNWLFTTLTAQLSFLPNWLPVESNDDGIMIGQYSIFCNDESFYPHGMIMMALAAAGPYDKNYLITDAIHNPALNLTVPASVPTIGGWTYYKLLQDMMEFAAWAQADPGTWGRGGWRYCPNDGQADNSVGQWPVIGLEAAERWGIAAPPWVKDELKNYWLQNSYNSSYGGWGYDGTVYVEAAHSGTGFNMMAYVGIPKTDPWYVNALDALAAHWSNQSHWTWEGWYWDWWPSHFGNTDYGQVENYYAMYGIAKAMRIARDSSGNISEVTQIGTHNWYDEYSAFLKGIQQGDGSWPGFFYWGHPVSTAFAILVLEPTVASLRPVAEISASPNPTPPNKNVTFNISGSIHQDPDKWLVSWKIDYDASNGVNWAAPDRNGVFPAVPIVKTGGYPETGSDYDVTATLQVTDNTGETAEAVVVVHVTSANVAPIAKPGGPYFGRVGTPIAISGSASYDPNPGDTIVSYQWDLDGDAQYDDAVGVNVQHTWNTPYSGSIGLKVCDNWGACSTGSAYTNITIADLKPVSYPLISYRRIDRYVWEYVYKFVIKNEGNGNTTNVSAQLQNWPNQVSVIDGNVSFGNVAAGQQVTSQDTFTIRINRQTALQKADLTWKLTYTDSAGATWIIVNFPLYP
jgi:hypothetical protein